MTNEEKNNITYGQTDTSNGCSGVSGSVPRLGYPGLCLNDAGNGVRGTDGVNSYASGIHVGASWNRDLANTRARFMGAEFKAKGINAALGPVVGPLGRLAEGGRNWEGFSNDPYLCGQLTSQTITGLQESVIATVKHFIVSFVESAEGIAADQNIRAMSKNHTETQKAISHLSAQISTTRQFTSYTSGHSKMRFKLELPLSCLSSSHQAVVTIANLWQVLLQQNKQQLRLAKFQDPQRPAQDRAGFHWYIIQIRYILRSIN